MSYSFRPQDRTIGDGVRRIAERQTAQALETLEDRALSLDAKVHGARKRSKKLRGLLRLVRPGLATYEAENEAIRDAARRLGTARDAAATLETFMRLSESYEGYLSKGLVADILFELRSRRAGLTDTEMATALDETAADLKALKARVPDWRIKGDEEAALTGGLEKALKKRARETGVAEDFHEWRKWAKYHWLHVRLLKKIWPEGLLPRAVTLERITAALGTHHDLYVLCELIESMSDAQQRAGGFLEQVAAPRMAALEAEALDLGARVFAEDPAIFATRCAGYWRLAHSDELASSAS